MAEKKRISFLRQDAAASGNGDLCALAIPAEIAKEYPALAEYMSALAFPNGSEREVSTITLLLEDGKLKGCVNDRANQKSLWRSGDTVAEVLACLDAALQDERVVWRKWNAKFKLGGPKK